MIIKSAVAALALILIPTISLANLGCSARGNLPQSCAEGSTWDVAQQTCIQPVNS